METKDKEYTCGYNHCLHHGEKVKASESVVIGKKHYHMDCAEMKQKINECAKMYMECTDDKTKFPLVAKVLNNLVFRDKVPIDFIFERMNFGCKNYAKKSPLSLYDLRRIFWEHIV